MAGKRGLTAIIIVILVVAGIAVYTILGGHTGPSNSGGEAHTTTTTTTGHAGIGGITLGNVSRTVLIYDSLYREFPDDEVLDHIVRAFEEAGFSVDVYKGRNATLDQLVAMGKYGIVVIRAHGAYNGDPSTGKPLGTYVYTGLYVVEAEALYGVDTVEEGISNGLYAPAVIPREGVPVSQLPKYLSVSPKFFKTMAASLNNTIVFFTGCFGMTDNRLAETLLSRGASVFIGWEGNVTWIYSDEFLEAWVDALIKTGDPVKAVETVNATMGPDPDTGAQVRYLARW